MELDINRKHIPIGGVAYYIKNDAHKPLTYHVAFGIVEEHYASEIALQLYEIQDRRTINGIPIKEFKTPTEWKKLPKKWQTKDFIEYGYEEWPEDIDPKNDMYHINKPDEILKAIEKGILVKVQDNDHARFDTEIDKQNGWRITRNYPWYDYHPTWVSLYHHDAYATYEEAKAEIDRRYAELDRQAALSDYEWSLEQIDKTLNKAVGMCYITEQEKENIRNRILEMENIEDLHVRLTNTSGGVEWRYEKQKRWRKFE